MKQWTERDCTSQAGIAKLYRVVTDMGYIWRPRPNSDVGLDGEIELFEDRAATAKMKNHILPAAALGAGVREQRFCRFDGQQPHRRGCGKNSKADSTDSSEVGHSALNRTPGVHDRGDKRERV